jgi:hypothetical protein
MSVSIRCDGRLCIYWTNPVLRHQARVRLNSLVRSTSGSISSPRASLISCRVMIVVSRRAIAIVLDSTSLSATLSPRALRILLPLKVVIIGVRGEVGVHLGT